MKLLIAGVFQPGEFLLKKGGNRLGTGTAILGTEVEIITVPSRINVHNVVKTFVFWLRSKMFGLQNRVNERLRSGVYVSLDGLWHFRLGGLCRAVYPPLTALCHVFSSSQTRIFLKLKGSWVFPPRLWRRTPGLSCCRKLKR